MICSKDNTVTCYVVLKYFVNEREKQFEEAGGGQQRWDELEFYPPVRYEKAKFTLTYDVHNIIVLYLTTPT